jgi:predicted SnoaL-like aldol condensation-catalyzing enzyme
VRYGHRRDQFQLAVVRTLQDGQYVVTQAKGQRSGKELFFDNFRSEDDLVEEHWALPR